MRLTLSFFFSLCSFVIVAQKTAIYTDEARNYKVGQELFDKKKYAAAQDKFEQAIQRINDNQNEIQIDAEYYRALCALELFNKDAEFLFQQFVLMHPDNPRAKTVYYQLGRHSYQRKKFKDAIKWLEKVDEYDLPKEHRVEYNFKLGHSYFQKKKYDKAKQPLHFVKDQESDYSNTARYYFGHIEYVSKNYQTALIAFKKLETDPSFKRIVPYYIGQIYYNQNKHDELIKYGNKFLDSVTPSRKTEFYRIVGDAYYCTKRYKEAIPHLEYYKSKSKLTREENYQLAYAYYSDQQYKKAATRFSRVVNKKDSLAQVACYQAGDSYLKLKDKKSARGAFRKAAEMEIDKEIQEDALFNYAKIAYELSDNPYHDAVKAFEEYLNKYPKSERKREVYEYLIDVYMSTKDYKSALSSLAKIKHKDFRMQEAYQLLSFNLAVELYHNGKYTEAKQNFENAKKFKINKEVNAKATYWTAEMAFKQKNYGEAIGLYKKFMAEPRAYLLPEHHQSHYNIGYAYFLDTNYTDAISSFRSYCSNSSKIEPAKKADAYLKIGDAYFMRKQDAFAIDYYERAIMANCRNLDYAYYQAGFCSGLTLQHEQKIQFLEKLRSKFPKSPKIALATFDLGEANRVLGNNEDALKYYGEVVNKYPKNTNVKRALFQMAGVYYRMKEFAQAEKYYNQVIDEYGNSSLKEDAVDQMRDVYEAQNKLPSYLDWLDAKGVSYSEGQKDSTLWKPAYEAFVNKKYAEAIPALETYVSSLTNPKNKLDAEFYLADSKHILENDQGALPHYKYVIQQSTNDYTEICLVNAAKITFKEENFEEALNYFTRLEPVSTDENNLRYAIEGQMRCAEKLSRHETILSSANKILELKDLDNQAKLKTLLFKATSQYHLDQKSEAFRTYKKLTKSTKSVKGAEARYFMAKIHFEKGEYDECESAIQKLVSSKPSYDYWNARAIILLGDKYFQEKDYLNAKNSWESIVTYYEGEEEDQLKKKAQDRLNKAIKTESQEGSIPEEEKELNINVGSDSTKTE